MSKTTIALVICTRVWHNPQKLNKIRIMMKQSTLSGYVTSLLAPVSAFIVYCLHASLFRRWLVDDAGISFAYAHNFIHGHGLVSQIGVPPVEGFSNFLWTILLSPLFISPPSNPAIPVKILSAVCILITYLILQKCIVTYFSDVQYKRWITALILILLSLNSSIVIWTTSGLENPLYILLSVLLFYLILKHESSAAPTFAMPIVIAITGTLIGLTRPDGIVFAFVFPLYCLIKMLGDRAHYRTVIRHAVIYVLFFAVLYGSFMIFRYTYFNDTKPNPYYVKGGPTVESGHEVILHTRYYVTKTYDILASMLSRRTSPVILALIIISSLFFQRVRKRMPYIILLLMLLTSWAVYSLLPLDWMGEFRFASPFFVFFYSFLGIIVSAFLSMTIKKPAFRIALIAVLGIVFIASTAILGLPRSRRFAADSPLKFFRVARVLAYRFNCYADMLGIGDTTLLCPDAGGTLYFSRHVIYDLGGLCDRTIGRTLEKDTQKLKDYIFDDIKPTFIQIHDYWSMITDLEYDPRFRRDYLPIREGISSWAAKRTDKPYHSGNYVRKDALRDRRILDELREQMVAECRLPIDYDPKMLQPFPRR